MSAAWVSPWNSSAGSSRSGSNGVSWGGGFMRWGLFNRRARSSTSAVGSPPMRSAVGAALLLLLASRATAEVVRIDVRQRDDFGTHERIIGRVHFAIDPTARANAGIADGALAPRNASGRVEFSSDVLFFMPKREAGARGTVFLEVVNRGRDQSLALMSDARQRDFAPERWDLGDRFALAQGFAVAFLGWQFDVRPSQGLTFEAPLAPVRGLVRASYVEDGSGPRYTGFGVQYCARDANQPGA